MNPPIRLSYHGSVHYNSVVDPFTPTVGVGLGLANYIPGQADANLMNEAKLASERQHIEEAMLKDKMKLTDWEKTEQELERQVASESYMEYLRQIERQSEQTRSKTCKPTRNDSTTHLSRSAGPKSKPIETQQALKLGTSNKSNSLGVKRGASSPNLPCTSRQTEEVSVPLAKIHRNGKFINSCTNQEFCLESASMPNIGESFGNSLNGASTSLLIVPKSPENSKLEVNKPEDDESQAGTSKQDEPKPSMSLYEELLASSATYGDVWEEDAPMLAEIIALSQQEFLDNLKKSPRQ